MPVPIAIPIALGAASFLGGMFGKNKQTQRQTSTTTPTFDPAFGGLRDKLIAQAMRLSGSGGFDAARNITNTNLQNLNDAAGAARMGLGARLAGQGIRGGAQAGALGAFENARFGAGINIQNQEPILARQFGLENMQAALGVLGLGRGQTTTGTGTAESGGGFGAGLGDLGGMLGWLAANGMLNLGGKKPPVPGAGGSQGWE